MHSHAAAPKWSLSVLLLLALALALPARSAAAPTEVDYLSPASSPLTLPKTTVGEKSSNVDFTLTNTSGDVVAVNGIAVVGASGFTYAGGTCQMVLTPGAECSVGLSFKPEAPGPAAGTLEIGFADATVELLSLAGEAVEPEIAFVPASEDFGLVPLREQANGSLLLINEGEAPVTISGSGIEGAGAPRFFYEFSGCQGHGLNPGETCTVPLRFEPQDRVDYEATLRAFAGSATATATLKGRGGGPVIEPGGPLPGFGPVTVGSSGVVRTVTLQNSGDLPAGFFIGILSGGDAASFQLLSENCTMRSLAPGATCSAQVRFRPLSAGQKSATLAFFGDGDGGALVPLDGVGVDAVTSLSTAGLDFGSVAAGERSSPLQIMVRNGGIEPLETGQIAIVGADLDQFVLAGDECTGEAIAPGAECALRIRFAPDGAGAKSARLRVAIPGGSLTATLAGTATAAPSPAAASQGKAKSRKKHRKHKKHRHHRKHRHHHGGHRSR